MGRRRPKQHMPGRAPTIKDGDPGTRGAHLKHAAHGCDAGGVEAQRLIEHLRVLPSREERAYIRRGPRCGPAQTGGYGSVAAGGGTCTGRAPTKGLGAVHDCGERTLNMFFMVVTLDVSKLSG